MFLGFSLFTPSRVGSVSMIVGLYTSLSLTLWRVIGRWSVMGTFFPFHKTIVDYLRYDGDMD